MKQTHAHGLGGWGYNDMVVMNYAVNLGPKNGLVNVHIQRDSNYTEIHGVCTSNVGHKSGFIQDMKGKQSFIQWVSQKCLLSRGLPCSSVFDGPSKYGRGAESVKTSSRIEGMKK